MINLFVPWQAQSFVYICSISSTPYLIICGDHAMLDVNEKNSQDAQAISDKDIAGDEGEHTIFRVTGLYEPDLSFTKVTYASFNGAVIDNPSWNKIFRKAHDIVLEHGASREELEKLPIYIELPGEGDEPYVTLRGMSAKVTWKMLRKIALMIGASMEVEFMWGQKADSHLRGKTGRLSWSPGN
jgi:hypothetical protein